ncbi:MAG: carboxypeptidase regulatory-like domain-containing protein [Acidobacteriota bacterium]
MIRAAGLLVAGLLLAAASPVVAGPLLNQGRISGRALDGAGRILSGVKILVAAQEDGGHPLKGWTDSLGRFLFRHLPPRKEYLLVATKSGYLAAVARIRALPATGIELFLRPLTEKAGADMNWVLRLPGRDLLRDLRDELVTAEPFIQRSGSLSGEPVRAEVEQRMGQSQTGGGLGAGRDLGTRVEVAGPVSSRVRWQSTARVQSRQLGEDHGGRFREDTEMGVSAGLQMGEAEKELSAGFRFRTREAGFGQAAGGQQNRALGLDLVSDLKGLGHPHLSFHLRDLASRPTGIAADGSAASRRSLGLSMMQTYQVGRRHRLETAVTVRHFSQGEDGGGVVPDNGAGRPGENVWLAPRGNWVILSVRDRQTPGEGLHFSYGLDLERTDREGMAWIPGMDLEWRPAARTRLSTGFKYRRSQDPDSDTVLRQDPSPLSARLSILQELTQHTSLTIGVRQQRLSLLDPFAGDDWSKGGAFSGVWTDGVARSRGIRVSLSQELGSVVGRLSFLSGEMQGQIAVPDPFTLGAAPFRPGSARFKMVQAVAVVPGSRTEVSMALRELASGQLDEEIRIVGIRFSQGLQVPFRVPGQWRILVDYESIGGGRPFSPVAGGRLLAAPAATSAPVARVSGGVAVRF